MSTTSCESCRRAELPAWRRLWEDLFPPRRSPFDGLSATLGAFLGTAAPTPYEQHKDRYAETGDPLEYERMLRHVK